MKNKDLFKVYTGLKILTLDNSIKLNALTTFKLVRNKKVIEPIYESLIYTQKKLFDNYADNTIVPPTILPEQIPKFQAEYDKLMDEDIEIKLDKVNIEDFKEVQINLSTMEYLMPIIE